MNNFLKNRVLDEDIKLIAESNIDFSMFKNSSILVTGATGLIGSLLIKTLVFCNQYHNLDINIIGLARSKDKVKNCFGDLLKQENLIFIYNDINEKIETKLNIDYIIHTVSVTASKTMVTYPIDTICTSFLGTKNILDLAVEKKSKGVVYLSSMEVYGVTDSSLEYVKEENLGYIDLSSIRSSYSESKRMCELLCLSYSMQYGVPVRIARLAQTFGAGISKEENRVFAQFARCAMNNKNIVLHTLGNSEGNYCYTRDAIKAILLLLYKGENGESYNVSNEETHTTIVNMAKMVCEKFGNNNINVIFDIPENNLVYGYAPEVKMRLSSGKITSLGWNPEVGLEEAYSRMIQSMSEQ